MTRFLTLIALTFVLTTSAHAQEFTPEQQVQIKKMFEDYILNNGETIIKGVEKYQEVREAESRKESEAQAQEFLKTIENNQNLPMTGNKAGDITLVEFFDFNCGYCTKAFEELVSIVEQDKNLKVIFFDMPILSPSSFEASKWALAAHKQGKYFEFHQALFEHQGPKDATAFEKIAKDLKLDLEQLKKDAESDEIKETLKKNTEQAQAMNIRGTPGFIIEGQVFPGFMQADKILDIINEARLKKANKG